MRSAYESVRTAAGRVCAALNYRIISQPWLLRTGDNDMWKESSLTTNSARVQVVLVSERSVEVQLVSTHCDGCLAERYTCADRGSDLSGFTRQAQQLATTHHVGISHHCM